MPSMSSEKTAMSPDHPPVTEWMISLMLDVVTKLPATTGNCLPRVAGWLAKNARAHSALWGSPSKNTASNPKLIATAREKVRCSRASE